MKKCPAAVATPEIKAMGHNWATPRPPSRIHKRMRGMKHAKIHERWPILAATARGFWPPKRPAVVVGIAIAPKPTLIALPTMVTTAAFTGGRPSETSIAATIATGAPKPARPSSRPQKEKAMINAWTRISPLPIVLKTARMSLLRPETSVRL